MEPTAESPNEESPIDASAVDEELVASLAAATPEERQEILTDLVVREASQILESAELDEESNFLENGLSSLSALKLSKSLMNNSGLEVPLVAIVEHPTPTLLGKFLAETYETS
ncbi:acyl carrier protein [Streptomyces sp. 6N223]|uniref:acyl carrier protein n=1 Tax=Streptomyces sp. 6N223 TaxID=3457412 RepID=UPI003FD363DB